MTNSDWWARAKTPPRPQTLPARPRERLRTLYKGRHEVTLETRVVHGVGDELILSINGHWRRMRVFRPTGQTVSAAVTDTVDKLEALGWRAQ